MAHFWGSYSGLPSIPEAYLKKIGCVPEEFVRLESPSGAGSFGCDRLSPHFAQDDNFVRSIAGCAFSCLGYTYIID
jgi:hypothetical protein